MKTLFEKGFSRSVLGTKIGVQISFVCRSGVVCEGNGYGCQVLPIRKVLGADSCMQFLKHGEVSVRAILRTNLRRWRWKAGFKISRHWVRANEVGSLVSVLHCAYDALCFPRAFWKISCEGWPPVRGRVRHAVRSNAQKKDDWLVVPMKKVQVRKIWKSIGTFRVYPRPVAGGSEKVHSDSESEWRSHAKKEFRLALYDMIPTIGTEYILLKSLLMVSYVARMRREVKLPIGISLCISFHPYQNPETLLSTLHLTITKSWASQTAHYAFTDIISRPKITKTSHPSLSHFNSSITLDIPHMMSEKSFITLFSSRKHCAWPWRIGWLYLDSGRVGGIVRSFLWRARLGSKANYFIKDGEKKREACTKDSRATFDDWPDSSVNIGPYQHLLDHARDIYQR